MEHGVKRKDAEKRIRGQKSDDRGRRSRLIISKFEINKVLGVLESKLWERLSSRDFNDNKNRVGPAHPKSYYRLPLNCLTQSKA